MWVWRKLGYDDVSTLPPHCLAPLGARCRVVDEGAADKAPAGRCLRDESGCLLELLPRDPGQPLGARVGQQAPSSAGLRSSSGRSVDTVLRLHVLGSGEASEDVALCVPHDVSIQRLHGVRVAHAASATLALGAQQLAAGLRAAVSSGKGSVAYHVPIVTAKLSDRASSAQEVGPMSGMYPLSIEEVVLGAELVFDVDAMTFLGAASAHMEMRVTSTSLGDGDQGDGVSDEMVDMMQAPLTIHPGRQAVAVVPEAVNSRHEDFSISFSQRGGPLIDPSTLHGKSIDEIVKYVLEWTSQSVPREPRTWEPIIVGPYAASDVPEDSSDQERTCQMTCETTLATTATVRFCIDSFELECGPVHQQAMRQSLEREAAGLLGLPVERILAGDVEFEADGRQNRRTTTVRMGFAILHSHVVTVRDRQENHRIRRKMIPDKLATLRGHHTGDLRQLHQSDWRGGTKRSILRRHVNGRPLPTVHARSAPDLHALAALPRGTRVEVPGDDHDPHVLMKRFIHRVSDDRTVFAKLPDAVPMLVRIRAGGVAVSGSLVAAVGEASLSQLLCSLQAVLKRQAPEEANLCKSFAELKDECREALCGHLVVPEPISWQDGSSQLTRCLQPISRKRQALMSALVASTQGIDLGKVADFRLLSAMDLLQRLDMSHTCPSDRAACLEVLISWTASDQDAERRSDQCVRLRQQSGIHRVGRVMKNLKNDNATLQSCVHILRNLALSDPGCVDDFLAQALSPTVIEGLLLFPRDRKLQCFGCALLRAVYARARETVGLGINSVSGPRVIALGPGLTELWTYKGVDCVLAAAASFEDDADLQLDVMEMLTLLSEPLYNSAKVGEVFERVAAAMEGHSDRVDIQLAGLRVLESLGPSYTAREERVGVLLMKTMARHRSKCQVQRTGAHTLLTLAGREPSLEALRRAGAVASLVYATFSHSRDPQTVEETTRSLEKFCPSALRKMREVCNGDLMQALPVVEWRSDPLEPVPPPILDFPAARASGLFKPEVVDRLAQDLKKSKYTERIPREESALAGELDSPGNCVQLGLKEELDLRENLWAAPAPRHVPCKQLRSDIHKLDKALCYSDHLIGPGPKDAQLRRLIDMLSTGVLAGEATKKFDAVDAEVLLLLLGHFAWHSAAYAEKLLVSGAAGTVAKWMMWSVRPAMQPRLPQALVVEGHAFRRACLTAISGLLRHCRSASVSQEAISSKASESLRQVLPFVLESAIQWEPGMRCRALRCLARILSVADCLGYDSPMEAATRAGREAQAHDEEDPFSAAPLGQKRPTLPMAEVYDVILRGLRFPDGSEIVQAAAAACAGQSCVIEWLQMEGNDGRLREQRSLLVSTLFVAFGGVTPVQIASSASSQTAPQVSQARTRLARQGQGHRPEQGQHQGHS
eukprot:TRINITY_DN4043_c1_g1_i2.p1 TRINITY_DN4043_c1_g1~~TRINITY_DN4043_c1_g1_i2.p1  ORF type:complete len:1394 (+),score=257.72 TRINITY_DN4043_c1_g1_i2:147-4328(+)